MFFVTNQKETLDSPWPLTSVFLHLLEGKPSLPASPLPSSSQFPLNYVTCGLNTSLTPSSTSVPLLRISSQTHSHLRLILHLLHRFL